MKNLLAGFTITMLLVTCSSGNDDIIPNDDNHNLPDTIVCCQAVMGTSTSPDIVNGELARGNAIKIESPYPLDTIYLLSHIDDYKTTPEHVLAIPVKHYNSTSYIDLCFALDKEHAIVHALAGGKQVSFYAYWGECIFSSSKDGLFNLNLNNSLLTPGKQKVHKAYGDRVFYSKVFRIGYKDIPQSDEVDFYFDIDDEKDNIPVNGNEFPFILSRGTSLVETKLVITNINKNGRAQPLKKEEFQKELGLLDDWSFHVFMDNVPASISLDQIINSNTPTGDNIIALSKDTLKMGSVAHKTNKKNYEGFGAENGSKPYIFPMPTNTARLCFTFYYKGKKKDFIHHTTLPIPLQDLNGEIGPNTHWYITTVIDYLDLKEAITQKKNSASSRAASDIFGKIIDIPYKTIITKE